MDSLTTKATWHDYDLNPDDSHTHKKHGMLVTQMQECIKGYFPLVEHNGRLCSWLACSLIKLEVSGSTQKKLEVSGSITTLEHNLCQEDSLTGQNGWIWSYTIS